MKREELRLSEYPFTIRPLTADEGGGYLIEFPDVPLCMSDGESEAEPKSLHAWLTVRSAQEGVSLNTLAVALIAEGRGKRESGSQNAKRARKTRAA